MFIICDSYVLNNIGSQRFFVFFDWGEFCNLFVCSTFHIVAML